MVLAPMKSNAATLRLTDTGVSTYIECLGARWEMDSAEVAELDRESSWVRLTCVNVARYGLIRVRPRGSVWGRETFVLDSPDALESYVANTALAISHIWPPW